MDVPIEGVEIREIPPEEAFSILGNELRMEILRALWEAGEPCPFSELRRQVAPEDRGNFSYHLGKLTGHFVRKTDEGYALRFAGEQVVRAALTGTITSDPKIPSTETDERCLYCGTRVRMEYDEEVLSVRCPTCGGVIGDPFPDGTCMHFEFPPAGLEGREHEEIIYAAHVLYDSKISPMMKGVCPECAGRIDISFDCCPDHEMREDTLCPNCNMRYEVFARFECEHCLYGRQFPPWYAALNHPAVVAFYYRHGLEEKIPFRKITWDNERFMRDVTSTVAGTNPYRFRVVVPIDDEQLVVTLDDRLDVLQVEKDQVDG